MKIIISNRNLSQVLSAVATNRSSRILRRKSANRDIVVVNDAAEVHVDAKTHESEADQLQPRRRTVTLYFITNFIFIVGVFLLSFFGHKSGHNPALYLILLVALLSSPLLFVRSFTGPYMVLWIAAPFFFLMFGIGDLVAYLSDEPSAQVGHTSAILSYGEVGVLTAILSLFLGYAGAVRTLKSPTKIQSNRYHSSPTQH